LPLHGPEGENESSPIITIVTIADYHWLYSHIIDAIMSAIIVIILPLLLLILLLLLRHFIIIFADASLCAMRDAIDADAQRCAIISLRFTRHLFAVYATTLNETIGSENDKR